MDVPEEDVQKQGMNCLLNPDATDCPTCENYEGNGGNCEGGVEFETGYDDDFVPSVGRLH